MRSKYDWNEIHRGPSLGEILTFVLITAVMLLGFFLAVAYAGELEEEMLLSVSKSPVVHVQSSKSADILDEGLLNEEKPLFLQDSLSGLSGIHYSSRGGLNTFYLRGMRSFDTKLLYNGFPLIDPSDTQGTSTTYLQDFWMGGIDRVEIIKGASSSTHGSEGMAGHIAIEDKLGLNYLKGEYGSNNSPIEEASVSSGPIGLAISHYSSDGFDGHDDYELWNGRWNGEWETERIKLEASGFTETIEAALNESPFILGGKLIEDADDENDTREYKKFHQNGKITFQLLDRLKLVSRAAYSRITRRFTFRPDEDGTGFFSDGTYKGEDYLLDNYLTYELCCDSSITIGSQYERQFYELDTPDGNDEADQYLNDFYAEWRGYLGPVSLNLQGRMNDNEHAKGRSTYSAGVFYQVPQTGFSLRANLSTGFRIPSLYERYGAFLTSFGRFEVGNSGLSPERSLGMDMGLSWSNHQSDEWGTTFFRNEVENKIDFIGFSYANTEGKDSSYGVEAYYEKYINKWFLGRVAYTYTTGDFVLNTPTHMVSATFRFFIEKLIANLRVSYVGEADILAFNLDTFNVDKLRQDDRVKVDLTISYPIKDAEVYVRIENLLNEDSLDAGYQQEPFGVYGGVKWSF